MKSTKQGGLNHNFFTTFPSPRDLITNPRSWKKGVPLKYCLINIKIPTLVARRFMMNEFEA
jgi:hypothetical protein